MNVKIGNILVIIFLIVVIFFSYSDFNKTTSKGKHWMDPVVSKEEIAAINWVKNNTAERTTFAACIFGGELIMGLSLREGTEGGDWSIVKNPVERMSEINEMFAKATSERAYEIARKYGAKYVWLPNRSIFCGYKWFYPSRQKFENKKYFKKVFDNGVAIYEVNEVEK